MCLRTCRAQIGEQFDAFNGNDFQVDEDGHGTHIAGIMTGPLLCLLTSQERSWAGLIVSRNPLSVDVILCTHFPTALEHHWSFHAMTPPPLPALTTAYVSVHHSVPPFRLPISWTTLLWAWSLPYNLTCPYTTPLLVFASPSPGRLFSGPGLFLTTLRVRTPLRRSFLPAHLLDDASPALVSSLQSGFSAAWPGPLSLCAGNKPASSCSWQPSLPRFGRFSTTAKEAPVASPMHRMPLGVTSPNWVCVCALCHRIEARGCTGLQPPCRKDPCQEQQIRKAHRWHIDGVQRPAVGA